MFLFSHIRIVGDGSDVALVIDEIYSWDILNAILSQKIISINQRNNLKLLWVAFIETGISTSHLDDIIEKFQFNVAKLKILFRNAHHISDFCHRYIEQRSTETITKVPGCFYSSQNRIKFSVFRDLDQVTGLSPAMMEDSFASETSMAASVELDPSCAFDRLVILITDEKIVEERRASVQSAFMAQQISTMSIDHDRGRRLER